MLHTPLLAGGTVTMRLCVTEPRLVVLGIDDVLEHVHRREMCRAEIEMNHTNTRRV